MPAQRQHYPHRSLHPSVSCPSRVSHARPASVRQRPNLLGARPRKRKETNDDRCNRDWLGHCGHGRAHRTHGLPSPSVIFLSKQHRPGASAPGRLFLAMPCGAGRTAALTPGDARATARAVRKRCRAESSESAAGWAAQRGAAMQSTPRPESKRPAKALSLAPGFGERPRLPPRGGVRPVGVCFR